MESHDRDCFCCLCEGADEEDDDDDELFGSSGWGRSVSWKLDSGFSKDAPSALEESDWKYTGKVFGLWFIPEAAFASEERLEWFFTEMVLDYGFTPDATFTLEVNLELDYTRKVMNLQVNRGN